MGFDRNNDRGKKPETRRARDPYNSLPAGSGAPHMTSRGVIELMRNDAQRDASGNSREREQKSQRDVSKDDPKSMKRPRGFDPYNSDG